MTPPTATRAKLPLVLLLLVLLQGITRVHSQGSSRVGAVTKAGVKDRTTSSSPKQSSLVLPAVLQVLQAMSEQIEDTEGPKKEPRKGGISGQQMPPYLLQLVILRNSLVRAAKKRNMSNYNGYSDDVMELLVQSSEGTAGQQLKMLLGAMLERKELMSEGDEVALKELTRKVLKELEDEKSDLNALVGDLKPIKYT